MTHPSCVARIGCQRPRARVAGSRSRLLVEDVVVDALQRLPVLHHAAADGAQHATVRRDSVARRQPHRRRRHLRRGSGVTVSQARGLRRPGERRRAQETKAAHQQRVALRDAVPSLHGVAAVVKHKHVDLRHHGGEGTKRAQEGGAAWPLYRATGKCAGTAAWRRRGIRPREAQCARSRVVAGAAAALLPFALRCRG
jgi:hypothetical protein